MKTCLILILSGAAVFGADTGVHVSSTAATNKETGAVLTTESFTRGSHTNLVRVTKVESGAVVFSSQTFCHHGEPIAYFTVRDGYQSFTTVPNSPYQVLMDFLPSKDVRCVIISGKGFHEGFYATNGVFYPAPDSDFDIKVNGRDSSKIQDWTHGVSNLCPVHHLVMRTEVVFGLAGFIDPTEEYGDARHRLFPQAGIDYGPKMYSKERGRIYVCPACVQARQIWLKNHHP